MTWNRFIGLAGPSFFTVFLLAIGNAKIKYLLLSQLIVTIFNLVTIFVFHKKYPHAYFPESRIILKSALHGFPAYLAEYLVSWIVPFFILRVEGAEVLGWYAIALSYALLADVSYSALEAKNYAFMSSFSETNVNPPIKLFLRNSLPVMGMHIVFIPFVFLIPFIYGTDFSNSSIFALFILVARIPIVISRSITSYLISISRNTEPFIIFLSFIITFSILINFSDLKVLKFQWFFAYSVAAIVMLLCAITLYLTLSLKKYYIHKTNQSKESI